MTIDELQSQLDAVNLGVKEALETCRHTLEKAIDRVPVEESDHDEAESEQPEMAEASNQESAEED